MLVFFNQFVLWFDGSRDCSPVSFVLSPVPEALWAGGIMLRMVYGCRCLMPLCTSWLTHVRAGVLSGEGLYTWSCLQQLLPSWAAERAFATGWNLLWSLYRYYMISFSDALSRHLQSSGWEMSKLVRDILFSFHEEYLQSLQLKCYFCLCVIDRVQDFRWSSFRFQKGEL